MSKIETREIRRSLVAIFILMTFLAFLLRSAGTQSAPPDGSIVMKDVLVIDGRGGPPLEHAAIVIRGDRIVSVGAVGKCHGQNQHE